MFSNKNDFQPFESKVWLSSPTMYPDSMKYVMEAYETNWMSTVGANINEVERMACEKVGCLALKQSRSSSCQRPHSPGHLGSKGCTRLRTTGCARLLFIQGSPRFQCNK